MNHPNTQKCFGFLIIPMKIVESFNDTSNKEFGCIIVETPSVSHNGPKFATQANLHQHVYILPVLERLIQPRVGGVIHTSGP